MVDFLDAPLFAVTTASYERETRIVVRGEVDIATADQMGEALCAAEAGAEPIVLDLSDVTFMDSSGLRVLIEHARTSSVGDRLRIHVSDSVAHLIDLAGLADHLALVRCDDLRDAELAAEG